MKKIIFVTAVLITLLADKTFAQHFHAGVSFGGVVTDIPGADPLDGDVDFHKLGFTAGGLVCTQLGNPKNTFQFEINYTQKGSLQPPDSLNNGYARLSIDYVEVPLLIRHKARLTVNRGVSNNDSTAKNFRFEFEFGISVGRVVRFSDVVNGYAQSFSMNDLNKTEVSILGGINYHFTESFYCGFRFSNSVIPALKKNSAPLFLFPRTFNNGNNIVLRFSFNYIFGLKAGGDNAGNGG